MSIRKKILVYFSSTVIVLTGLSLFFIFKLFYEFREEEFQQRQREKILTTFNLISDYRKVDQEIMQSLEDATIQEIYDEKLIIYDADFKVIYESIDDTPVDNAEAILTQLDKDHTWIETKDGLYDVIGMYIIKGGERYYGISKAYDTFGYAQLYYLRNVLLITFLMIALIVLFVSYYLSSKIAQPITQFTHVISDYNFDSRDKEISIQDSGDELSVLVNRFNELMHRLNSAFDFQKHVVHHISHELKTPVAVLVSNFERMEKETDIGILQELIRSQKEDTKSLSEIISALLDISKAESGQVLTTEEIRVDELIFDIAGELNTIYPGFVFHIRYYLEEEDDHQLTFRANPRLLKLAFRNLAENCILYSSEQQATINLITKGHLLKIEFINKGAIIRNEELELLFNYFFRGENSQNIKGFGLGLVLLNKIITLNNGQVYYKSFASDTNRFVVELPLNR